MNLAVLSVSDEFDEVEFPPKEISITTSFAAIEINLKKRLLSSKAFWKEGKGQRQQKNELNCSDQLRPLFQKAARLPGLALDKKIQSLEQK